MVKKTVDEEVPEEVIGDINSIKNQTVNMSEIVGSHDILFICLDTLRYDVAKQEEETGGTPTLNQYGPWRKCHAPGNFTYPSHMAMFAGYLPSPAEYTPLMERERLFVPKTVGMGEERSQYSFCFEEATFIQGLENVGYETICIGGVGFFNKRSELAKVMPGYFKQSYWKPSFRCTVKESATHQVDFAIKKLEELEENQRTMMYINIDAIHYPNYFYVEKAKIDNVDTHAAALRYVDGELERLFAAFKNRGKTFVIVCSDHGTCYGEDGYHFHCLSHEIVNTVPYKHFVL
ncbi:MAG: STM4013/SEN3800 family hydrolase [Cellulosilyticaceae bacterium]